MSDALRIFDPSDANQREDAIAGRITLTPDEIRQIYEYRARSTSSLNFTWAHNIAYLETVQPAEALKLLEERVAVLRKNLGRRKVAS